MVEEVVVAGMGRAGNCTEMAEKAWNLRLREGMVGRHKSLAERTNLKDQNTFFSSIISPSSDLARQEGQSGQKLLFTFILHDPKINGRWKESNSKCVFIPKANYANTDLKHK